MEKTTFQISAPLFGEYDVVVCGGGIAGFCAAVSVFLRSIVIVIGPTPPGTGVIASTIGSTSSNTASPAIAPLPPFFILNGIFLCLLRNNGILVILLSLPVAYIMLKEKRT